jgi:hypothetical protein
MNIWKCLLVGLGIAAAGLLAMLGMVQRVRQTAHCRTRERESEQEC